MDSHRVNTIVWAWDVAVLRLHMFVLWLCFDISPDLDLVRRPIRADTQSNHVVCD